MKTTLKDRRAFFFAPRGCTVGLCDRRCPRLPFHSICPKAGASLHPNGLISASPLGRYSYYLPRRDRTRTPAALPLPVAPPPVYEIMLAEEVMKTVLKILLTWLVCQWARYGLQASVDGVLGRRDSLSRALRRPLACLAVLLAVGQSLLLIGDSAVTLAAFCEAQPAPPLLAAIIRVAARALVALRAPILKSLAFSTTVLATFAAIRFKDLKMNQWRAEAILDARNRSAGTQPSHVPLHAAAADMRSTGSGSTTAAVQPADAAPSPVPWRDYDVNLSIDHSFDATYLADGPGTTATESDESESDGAHSMHTHRGVDSGRHNLLVPKDTKTADRALEVASAYVERVATGEWDLRKALLPLQGMLSVPLLLVGSAAALASFGVSVAPLLALGGVGGLALGFSATFLVQNYLAGLQLIVSRPAMEGERIELRTTYGALVAGGTVVQVAPLRTELAGDDGAALFVPNKVMMDLVILNQSRATKEHFLGGARVEGGQLYLHLELGDAYSADQALHIARALRGWLERDPRVDAGKPCWTGLSGVGGHGGGPELTVLAYSRAMCHRAALLDLRQDLLCYYLGVREEIAAAEYGHGDPGTEEAQREAQGQYGHGAGGGRVRRRPHDHGH